MVGGATKEGDQLTLDSSKNHKFMLKDSKYSPDNVTLRVMGLMGLIFAVTALYEIVKAVL
jgi:hypothetical protein